MLIRLPIALAVLLALICVPAGAADTLVLSTGVGPPFTTPKHDGFLDQVIGEAFRRAGASVRITVHESSERALINANAGDDDGVVPRIKGLDSQYPNLIRVPEVVFDNDFVAYSLHHRFATSDWKSLAPYHVAYLIGWKIFENNLADHPQTSAVKDAGQLFNLLRMERTDVILYERWQGLWQARDLGLPVAMLEPPLARQEMFCYVNRKHARLVPAIAAALVAMKRDGSYRRIFDATLTPLTRPER
jgi:polar amino acid transport system substrate-binding protein